MNWIQDLPFEVRMALWTILVASLSGLACAWLGVWLVLRRSSMVGDAISHAVLPGLVGVFILFGTREPLPVLAGAVAMGLLTTLLTHFLGRHLRVHEDAGLGVVFTVLFALGVLLITRYAAQVDLDPGCVLYGLLEFVALDTRPLAGVEVPQALTTVVPGLALIGSYVGLMHRRLTVGVFDPRFALGVVPGARWVELSLMAAVAVATVAAFEAVGSILVIAMLVAPAATAQLLTRRLLPMFWIASGVVVLASVVGYFLAVWVDGSAAGMIAVVLGAIYGLAALVTRRRS